MKIANFWEKVNKTEGCWEWTGSKNKKGYGSFGVDGKTQKAHRVSWMLTFGELPEDDVLHTCDNPSCVRPDHLFVGTNQDNMRDMADKGRAFMKKGELHLNAKLTDAQVEALRQEGKTGTYMSMGAKLGVSDTHVRLLLNNKRR